MRHRAKGRQLSRTSTHRKAMLNNMATSLFQHGAINTTTAKAKELRPFAERLITLARRGDLHARRLAGRKIKDRDVLGRLFTEIGPRFAEPSGRLHPDPQAGPPRRRRRGDRPDRAARRVTTVVALAGNTKGTPEGPLFFSHRLNLSRDPSGLVGLRDGVSRHFVHLVRADAAGADPDAARARHRPGSEPSAGSDTSGASHGCWRG